MARVEALDPAEFLTPDDRAIADQLDLSHGDQERLMHTEIHHVGAIEVPGEEPHEAMVILTGPPGVTHQGGSKLKAYPSPAAQREDTINHGISMFYKNDDTEFGALKTVTDAEPYPRGLSAQESVDRRTGILTQLAERMVDAGLSDYKHLGTSGDEGTNGLIATVLPAVMANRGVQHSEALVTGKPDMVVRPSATGRGAAIAHRQLMRLRGETSAGAATQGAGFAGLYYAAEGYSPIDEADRDIPLPQYAIGDVRSEKRGDKVVKVPYTLHTDHPDGLPITHAMVDAVLLDPTDRDMQAVGHDKLLALARKIERTGVEVRVDQKDVLTYESSHPNMYLAPAATSNVLGLHNIGSISIKKWLEIGNHTVKEELLGMLGALDVQLDPGELVNSRGVATSYLEKRRDMARIEAEEQNKTYTETTPEEYAQIIRDGMIALTNLTHWASQTYGCDLRQARKLVSLANYAVANGMPVDRKMRHALLLGPPPQVIAA